MKLGVPVYEGVDLLDVAGPYEMFKWVDPDKNLEVLLVSADGKPVTTVNGMTIAAHSSFAATPKLDVLWVPGGDPKVLSRIMSDEASPYLKYLRQTAASAMWICSVCEGALLLARAGLLEGQKATTHWAFVDCLKRFPEIQVDTEHLRFVESNNRLTGGGISAGLDEALRLITLLFDEKTAEDVQVTTQYFPDPPVKGRIPATPRCTVHW